MSEPESMSSSGWKTNWKLVTRDLARARDSEARRLLDEGIAAVPEHYVRENVLEMLPRKRVEGRCRLCGRTKALTKEHIPPKSSGNKDRLTRHVLDDWLKAKHPGELGKGKVEQGGVFGFTLCDMCNTLTGRLYGNEYKRWAALATEVIEGFPHPAQLDRLASPLGWKLELGSIEDGGVRPGALVRQVLSCMCSLSGSWDLAERHPELPRIILEQSTEPLPNGLELGFGLFLGPHARMTGPQLEIALDEGAWRWVMELAHPPLSFLFVIASNLADSGLGLMMTDWVGLNPKEAKHFEGVVKVGFGWSPYPGDYRSRAAIAAQRSQ